MLAATLMSIAPKLFQKKGHAGCYALIAKIAKPKFLCWARTSLAFTSSNQPMNPRKIELAERTESGSALTNRTAAGTRRR